MKVLNIFDNFKLSLKMSVIGLLALLGLALPTYYYTTLSIESQQSTVIEQQGVQPASNVVMLNKAIAEHRGLSAGYLNGAESQKSSLNQKVIEVEQQFKKVEATLKQSDASDSLLKHLYEIKETWNSLKGSVVSNSINPEQSFSTHSGLITSGDLLISEISKFYLLSYDPAAASYHVIIANFQNLPRLSDSLGKVRGAGAGALAGQNISPSQKAAINGFLNNIESPLIDLYYNMESAAQFDDRFNSLSQETKNLKATIEQLTQITQREILQKETGTYASSTFFNDYSAAINSLYDIHNNSIGILESLLEERVAVISSSRTTTISIIIALLIISSIIGFTIVRSLNKSANKLIGDFGEIAKGNYEITFNTARKDEMGILEKRLSELNEQLKNASVVALEAQKIKQALDNSSTCFMMSDQDRKIIYMNDAVYTLFRKAESDIRKDLPNFNVETLIGTSIDGFHKNPTHQHSVLDKLQSVHEARLELGAFSFKLMINPIKDNEGNNVGNSVEWYDMTDIFEEERRVARILESLDSASVNVMIANADREIIYLNRSVQVMLKEVEVDLKKVLPHFDADNIIGKNIDVFHKDPSHQKAMLERMTSKHVAQITIGPRHFRLTASPIMDADGSRIGTVVEWLERTKEINAESEIAEIVEASLAGNFTKRINEEGKEDFLLTLAQGLNQLMKTTESGLNEVSNVLLGLSEGDLTKRVTSDYQGTFQDLKDYCNTTSSNLAGMISKIREASETINNASTEIAKGNSDLSVRTEQQASSLEETASSMEQITSTVRLNAENANQANGLASQAAEVAGSGGDLISQVVNTMSSINESSQKIADIIGVIDGIAFQTNILALNAAVEAARAGEQGRGFAVVASEVRTLAQRSANAAKDIKDLISDSVSKVESGNTLVNKSGETMQEIVVSIQRVNDIMSEIAAASAEQASGIDEVSKAVTQMDEMTQQNAALVEESAAAAESMSTQAGDLTKRVGTFKLKEGDSGNQFEASHVDVLSQQFEELPSATANKSSPAKHKRRALPVVSDEDEWESF